MMDIGNTIDFNCLSSYFLFSFNQNWDDIKRYVIGQVHRRTSTWLENLSNLDKSYIHNYICGDNIIKCRCEVVNVWPSSWIMVNTNTHVRAL